MGRGQNKDYKIDKHGLKQVLGRIFRPRHEEGGVDPFLLAKGGNLKVRLDHIINCITHHPEADDHAIVGHLSSEYMIHGVRPADIEIVRAYMHRFGSDIHQPFPIAVHPTRTLLLDENTPQPAMLSLSKNFGWATHVSAEGLAGRDTPDEDIWQFAHQHQFAAIVTRDTDFLEIQKRLGEKAIEEEVHTPLLIFVPENLSAGSLTTLFDKYADDVRYHLRAKSLACSLATEAGCHALHL